MERLVRQMVAALERLRPGWDKQICPVTAVNAGAGTCTITYKGVSIADVSYIVQPTSGDTVYVQIHGTQLIVYGPIAGP